MLLCFHNIFTFTLAKYPGTTQTNVTHSNPKIWLFYKVHFLRSPPLTDMENVCNRCSTIDSRSTFGLPLKTLGYNGSNELCGRSVASKLSPQQADDFVYQSDTQIREKRKFFSLRPPGRKRRRRYILNWSKNTVFKSLPNG